MDNLDAIMIIESGEATEDQYIKAMQSLIDSGTVWHLQGSYGRAAEGLITTGHCTAKVD